MQLWELSANSRFHAQIWKFEISPYLVNGSPWRNKLNFGPHWGQKESTYATLGPVFKFQISCPNKLILINRPYLKNSCMQSKIKLNFDPIRQQEGPYAMSGTVFECQVSCPNREILIIMLFLGALASGVLPFFHTKKLACRS